MLDLSIRSRSDIARFVIGMTLLSTACSVAVVIAADRLLDRLFGQDASVAGPWLAVAVALLVSPPVALLVAGSLQRVNALHDEIIRIAHIDPLTGVMNRAALFEAAAVGYAAVRRTGEPFAVLFVDIDHFKRINDTLGHDGGDAALRQVSKVLTETIGPRGTVGRLGGEEFVVVLPGMAEDDALAAAEWIVVGLRTAPFQYSGRSAQLTASIGIALGRPGDADVDCLLRRADAAMYAAKAAGRDRVVADSDMAPEQVAAVETGSVIRPARFSTRKSGRRG